MFSIYSQLQQAIDNAFLEYNVQHPFSIVARIVSCLTQPLMIGLLIVDALLFANYGLQSSAKYLAEGIIMLLNTLLNLGITIWREYLKVSFFFVVGGDWWLVVGGW